MNINQWSNVFHNSIVSVLLYKTRGAQALIWDSHNKSDVDSHRRTPRGGRLKATSVLLDK